MLLCPSLVSRRSRNASLPSLDQSYQSLKKKKKADRLVATVPGTRRYKIRLGLVGTVSVYVEVPSAACVTVGVYCDLLKCHLQLVSQWGYTVTW